MHPGGARFLQLLALGTQQGNFRQCPKGAAGRPHPQPPRLVGIVSATRHGARIKGGAHLEGLARPRTVAFDKTGVVTRGEPDFRELCPPGQWTESEILARLLAVKMRSEHPPSRAIVHYARAVSSPQH